MAGDCSGVTGRKPVPGGAHAGHHAAHGERSLVADGAARADRRACRPRSASLAGESHMTDTQATLERVTQVPGVKGSLLISGTDGLVVAERLMDGIDGRAIAALAASLVQRLDRATQQAGMPAPTFVHLRGNNGSVLAAPGRSDLVLVAVTGTDANLGLARVQMLDAVGRLA